MTTDLDYLALREDIQALRKQIAEGFNRFDITVTKLTSASEYLLSRDVDMRAVELRVASIEATSIERTKYQDREQKDATEERNWLRDNWVAVVILVFTIALQFAGWLIK